MLTVDFDRIGLRTGDRILDMGCGGGRHAFEAWRRGATVVALDYSEPELKDVRGIIGGMIAAGEIPGNPMEAAGGVCNGDALNLPFPDNSFDIVIASEVLEHLWADDRAIAELTRVLKPGGRMAVTVPNRFPERICWALDDKYHDTPGGHVRIYRRADLEAKLRRTGLTLEGHGFAHALHSPYWWIRCAGGVQESERFFARKYHDILVYQLMKQPKWLNSIDNALNPVLGKSVILYSRKAAA
ncbi:methyltransferase family protein [Actinobacteria bacterium IMCC26256]|nr:methyltransferase family protein [Actinobacteria bacterium IMCC26256]